MEEPKKTCECPNCAARAAREKEYDEMGFAFLLALTPMMVITLFGQMGLF